MFLAIGQHVGSSAATRLRSRRVVLSKPPSKTLNYTQGAEDARRALALQPSEPRLHSLRQAQPALAEHSSLHKSLPPLSSRARHLSLPPRRSRDTVGRKPTQGERESRTLRSACHRQWLFLLLFFFFLFDRRTVFAACQAHCTTTSSEMMPFPLLWRCRSPSSYDVFTLISVQTQRLLHTH